MTPPATKYSTTRLCVGLVAISHSRGVAVACPSRQQRRRPARPMGCRGVPNVDQAANLRAAASTRGIRIQVYFTPSSPAPPGSRTTVYC